METHITEARSTTDQSNIQEVLDSDFSKGIYGQQQAQYFTPDWLAQECFEKLPSRSPATVYDPQAGEGALLMRDSYYGTTRFASEIDNRIESISGVNLITSSCTKVWDLIDDLFPEMMFVCANSNCPFGRKWKDKDGKFVDSTEYTWSFLTRHALYGVFISNRTTIEKLGLHKSPLCYDYAIKQMADVWKGTKGEIGIVWWKHKDDRNWTSTHELYQQWRKINEAIEEEKSLRPKWNIFLSRDGILKTYLSVRNTVKLKLDWQTIQRLHRINDAHPLTLTTEKETRHLMRDLINAGIYNIEPAAKKAIEDALAEVNTLATPIMSVTPFETVAYADEEEKLLCIQSCSDGKLYLTKGKSYDICTASYKFSETFKRNKVHFNIETKETYVKEHECVLSGSDRFIQITDDYNHLIKFMDRPRKNYDNEFEEKKLWEYFKKPEVKTVGEAMKAQVAQNIAILNALEMTAGYQYYPGQKEYLARVAVKDHALAAGETGVGKSLMAISLIAMKSPQRALIVAPQGAIRTSESDDDEDEISEMDASQWHKELTRFAPYLPVFEIFSYEDYQRICANNGGELPTGAVYITYYEALFSNGAREKAPDSWDDFKLNKWAKAEGFAELPIAMDGEGENRMALDKRMWCDSVGREVNGIRCILQPCLATLIGDKFDCVMLDEAQRCCNLQANISQMLIRMQPKYRFALTATPIPNIITNLFSLMGWLAVPNWFKGGILNAAFPYAREDVGRFNQTFISQERDLTQEDDNRRKDPKWKGACLKDSPIISSPARLLKILKPTMAFISKADCNPNYIPPKVIDVRVNMGKEQSVLYGHFLDRANIPGGNPLIIARKQTAWLRNICADPAGFTHGGPKVFSNLNPKIIAIMELTRDIIARGEQVAIINSRIGLTSTLAEKLCESGISLARIDSTLPADQHSAQANLFKSGKAQVLLIGIKCAAAYSFDNCPNEIIGSLEFSPGPFNQAKGRIDRVTNKVVKNIYCILHKNSIEELMFDTVATKDDAATICLRGKRVPRDFKPFDAAELMAKAIERFDLSGNTPESECEKQWPELRKRLMEANIK